MIDLLLQAQREIDAELDAKLAVFDQLDAAMLRNQIAALAMIEKAMQRKEPTDE